jgi:hypothetical protein
MKSLKSLAPFSLIGIVGMIYTSSVKVFRWLSGAYQPSAGLLAAQLAARHVPVFGTAGWQAVVSVNAAILVSMLSTAYMAHYNAPTFY